MTTRLVNFTAWGKDGRHVVFCPVLKLWRADRGEPEVAGSLDEFVAVTIRENDARSWVTPFELERYCAVVRIDGHTYATEGDRKPKIPINVGSPEAPR